MNNRKILVPVDFSLQSDAALDYACAFARDYEAELLIVHVIDPAIQRLKGVEPLEAMDGLEAALKNVRPTDTSVAYSHRLLEGLPATTILQAADDENVEMIVMGTHGRSGLNRLVMGSVAEAVVRKAQCPVLTLRQPMQTTEPVAKS